MSRSAEHAYGGPGDAQIGEQDQIARPHGEDGAEATDHRERRWYHLRPEPRRRTDIMGFNSTWWMAVVWLIVIVLVVFPGPLW